MQHSILDNRLCTPQTYNAIQHSILDNRLCTPQTYNTIQHSILDNRLFTPPPPPQTYNTIQHSILDNRVCTPETYNIIQHGTTKHVSERVDKSTGIKLNKLLQLLKYNLQMKIQCAYTFEL